jgi:hypothetical protein
MVGGFCFDGTGSKTSDFLSNYVHNIPKFQKEPLFLFSEPTAMTYVMPNTSMYVQNKDFHHCIEETDFTLEDLN